VAYNWISFKRDPALAGEMVPTRWRTSVQLSGPRVRIKRDPALAGEMVPTRRRTSVQLSGPRVRTGALRFVRAHVPTAAPRDVF